MVDIFDDSILQRGAHGNVIEQRKVLHILAQPDAARVRAYWYLELRSHQQDGEHFVYAAETTAINLAKPDGFGLQQLLEDHAILAVLPSCHSDGRQGFGNFRVTEYVIGRCRLFNPVRLKFS